MSSVLFDSGDFQRLDRERTLIEQRERVPIQQDRSPVEESVGFDEPNAPNDFDMMLEGLLAALQRRL
jgi:hypothetical protein